MDVPVKLKQVPSKNCEQRVKAVGYQAALKVMPCEHSKKYLKQTERFQTHFRRNKISSPLLPGILKPIYIRAHKRICLLLLNACLFR